MFLRALLASLDTLRAVHKGAPASAQPVKAAETEKALQTLASLNSALLVLELSEMSATRA